MDAKMIFKVGKSQHRTLRLIFLPIIAGLLMAQAIGTLFVYLSNQGIFQASSALLKAGFFPIPFGQAMASLNSLGPALRGGIFFTLSIGIGLTLATWAACRIWDLLFKRNGKVLIICGVIWIGGLVWINAKGLVLFPCLFALLVPATTGWASIRALENVYRPKPDLWFTPVITLVLLTGLWATQLNNQIFASIRDHILLSNPVGRSVNDFYYSNTLYAAEAFRSFHQKTLRTCKFEGFNNDRQHERLIKRLLHGDVMVVPGIEQPDILLILAGGKLLLKSVKGKSIETTVDKMLADPNAWLSKFSRETDDFSQFRRMTFFGLLLGFPIFLFIFTYGSIRMVLGSMMGEKKLVLVASALCLIIGVFLFLPMLGSRPVKITKEGIDEALVSDRWTHRVAALRLCDKSKIEIARYPAYQKLITSPLVVERYWLARALGKSRSPSTYRHLLTLLQDPHPNVVCQAFYALGERGRYSAIAPIKQRLVDLDHWYAQWYGYKAMRRLGWHQGLSR